MEGTILWFYIMHYINIAHEENEMNYTYFKGIFHYIVADHNTF